MRDSNVRIKVEVRTEIFTKIVIKEGAIGKQILLLSRNITKYCKILPFFAAIPNSNDKIRYRHYLAFMESREISLISDVFCTSSSNLSLLESQQPANKLDQSLNRALR